MPRHRYTYVLIYCWYKIRLYHCFIQLPGLIPTWDSVVLPQAIGSPSHHSHSARYGLKDLALQFHHRDKGRWSMETPPHDSSKPQCQALEEWWNRDLFQTQRSKFDCQWYKIVKLVHLILVFYLKKTLSTHSYRYTYKHSGTLKLLEVGKRKSLSTCLKISGSALSR